MTTDVADRAQVKRLVDAAVEAFGRVDVMINNAGLMPQALLEQLRIDEWDRMIDVNLKGVLYGIAAALPYMQQQKSGHFINVSSVAGHKVGPGFAGLCGDQVRRARSVRGTAAGGEAVQHPHHDHLARRGGDGTARQRKRSGRSGARAQVLCGTGDPRRFVRARLPSPSASRTTWTSTKSCSGRRGRKFEPAPQLSSIGHQAKEPRHP